MTESILEGAGHEDKDLAEDAHLGDDEVGDDELDDGSDLEAGDLEAGDLEADDGLDGNRAVGALSWSVLDFVVRSIVDDDDAVEIDADQRPGRVDLAVTVAPSDMGKVIGRRGHVVQAIRTLVRATGAKEGIEASVEIVD